MQLLGKYKNGNYQVMLFDDGTTTEVDKHIQK